jgi:translocator protein
MKHRPKFTALLQLFAFAGMILMNALANSLPLNGYNTGQVSAFYPNQFVPAGFTFSIWGVIYLLLLGWVISSGVKLWKKEQENSLFRHVQLLSPYFLVSCLLNGLWIAAWHYLYIVTSLLLMLALLLTLLLAYRTMQQYQVFVTGISRLFLYIPFVVYLAWISVATIANSTALLVHLEWTGWGIPPSVWSVVLIAVAAALSVWFGLVRGEFSFVLVTAWAFWGIYNKQVQVSELVGTAALTACFLSLAAGSYGWWRTKSKASIDGVL